MTASIAEQRSAVGSSFRLIGVHRRLPMLCQKANSASIEAHEGLASQPLAIVGDDPISEVSTLLQYCKPRFNSLSVRCDIAGVDKQSDRCSDPCRLIAIHFSEHPAELAQGRKRHSNKFCFLQELFCQGALNGIVQRCGSDEDIGVGSNFHSCPAQPFSMASFISSIEMGRWPSRLSDPKKSSIFPEGLMARILISPPGSLSKLILSPGWTPRCLSYSFRSLTCPFAVMVTAFMWRVLSIAQGKSKSPYLQGEFSMLARCASALSMSILVISPGMAQTVSREDAARAAIHPVGTTAAMNHWLSRVPVTRAFPPDFTEELRGRSSAFVVEMSTAPGCVPCADLWTKLGSLGRRYGWQVRAISAQEAMLRSGRLGLPWIGHPVAWVRPMNDTNRIIPIAVGTDHAPNLARNLYLAAKMLTGVRPAVGVRALSKFTGIVGGPSR